MKRWVLALALVVLLGAWGCGGDGGVGESASTDGARAPAPAPAADGARASAPAADDARAPAPATVEPSRCPAGLSGCRTTAGRIVFVEAIDPDGDGDAHFVVADPQGITLPGLTAIDVRRGLRPRPLPGRGELISAAGQVQTGSYGQSQIHAVELHVAGR